MKRKITLYELYHKDFKVQHEYLYNLQDDIINQILNNQDKFIDYILRNHVKPPIKGEITKGKIKWRGITILNDIGYSKLWLRQRGVDIPIVFDYSINKII
jgi:hypothetical protein